MTRLLFLGTVVGALVPAMLAAQNAKGPCPNSVGLNAELQGYVMKPDHKPQRLADDVEPNVEQTYYQMVTPANEMHQMANGGATKTVSFEGVVDTLGRMDSTSVTITESPNGTLSLSVCAAAVQMKFEPATLGGKKVPAIYKSYYHFRETYDIKTTAH
jgi:hypothetical protein